MPDITPPSLSPSSLGALFQVLRARAAATPDRPAVSDGHTSLDHAGLVAWVAATARMLRGEWRDGAPPVVAILGGNRVEAVVAQLAVWAAGLTAVPLPPFFSPAQWRHIVADAGVTLLLCTPEVDAALVEPLGLAILPVSRALVSAHAPAGGVGDLDDGAGEGAAQIIYTSGSTGAPKGVLLEGRQLAWSTAALADAIVARPDDHYVSLLPLALLLETLCAVTLPLWVGARVTLLPDLTARFGGPATPGLSALIAAAAPTCLMLVPQLLAAWVADLEAMPLSARLDAIPPGLRLVAVGGAAVPPALAERAWALGIPVHEGYGLSECCSVVALNRPGARKAGTVGRPLAGLSVTLEDGEIIVTGPSVMSGYLGRSPLGAPAIADGRPAGRWPTGDVGAFDADGNLVVMGRRDALIVTPWGRNISPEWVESRFLDDPRLSHCLLSDGGEEGLAILLVPSAAGAAWFASAKPADVATLVESLAAPLPPYARPRRCHVASPLDLLRRGLFTPNGRLRRQDTNAAFHALLHPAAPAILH